MHAHGSEVPSLPLTAAEAPTQPLTLAEVGELYPLLAARLERLVRGEVRAPENVIEDACQFAWGRLVHRCHEVSRDRVLSWLAKVAIHEALKLIRRDDAKSSLELVDEEATPSPGPGPYELAEQRELLATVCALPARQQRVVWLKGVGFSYVEIARQSGCTRRTVERQLLRARSRLRAAAA